MKKLVNIFAIPTASQIEESLKKTSKTARKVNKNFSEEEKQLITPKQTKKNALVQVTPVVNLKNLNDPKAKQFVDTCTANYQGRFVEYCRKHRLDPKKVDFKDTGFWSDSHNFIDNLKLNPVQVYRDMI